MRLGGCLRVFAGDADGVGGFFRDDVFILRGEEVSYTYIISEEGSSYNAGTEQLVPERLRERRLVQLVVSLCIHRLDA